MNYYGNWRIQKKLNLMTPNQYKLNL
ncbi:IS3 family transposase [Malacoplasma iowae]